MSTTDNSFHGKGSLNSQLEYVDNKVNTNSIVRLTTRALIIGSTANAYQHCHLAIYRYVPNTRFFEEFGNCQATNNN